MAIVKVVRDTNLGTYMNFNGIEPNKLNPVLPTVNEVALVAYPNIIGNTSNRNEFVKDPSGQNWFIDYAGDGLKLGAANGISFFNSLSANFPATAQTNTTRVNVPSWTIPVIANKSYKIEVIATFNTGALTTGASMGLITSGGAAGNIHGFMEADISDGTTATALRTPIHTINTVNTTVGSFMTSTAVGNIAIPHSFILSAVFNCTTSGTINVQWGTEVANSFARLRQGSSLIVTILN
jgi:hypothetical protein